ncbi:hypothetical protein BC828DRAFT_372299 [Blastocladiella britannica]|nr:hypothetical protein BC828DRAFT_372299 [Blastocladiella britannica]
MFPHDTVSGHYMAPLSKAALYSVTSCTLGASLLHLKPMFSIHWAPHLSEQYQLHRLVISPLVFQTSAELLLGGVLLYHFRLLERLQGTRKYAVFATVTCTIATLMNVTTLVALRGWGVNTLASGPYAFLFANLFLYQARVPETDKFRLFGVVLSQKSFIQLIALLLPVLAGPTSLIPALSGYIAAAVYQVDLFGMQAWRFPAAIESIARRAFALVSDSGLPPPRPSNPEMPRVPAGSASTSSSLAAVAAQNARTTIGGGPGDLPAAPAVVEVSEESVQMLVAMGFPRERATAVLRRVGGDMNRAVQALV